MLKARDERREVGVHPSRYRTEEGNVPDYKGIQVRLSNEVKCDPQQFKIIMTAIDPILACIDKKASLLGLFDAIL